MLQRPLEIANVQGNLPLISNLFFLMSRRKNGRFEMRLLPSMALVFASYSLRSGAVLLNNSAAASPQAAASKSAAAQVLAAQLQDPVVEIRIESFMVRHMGVGCIYM